MIEILRTKVDPNVVPDLRGLSNPVRYLSLGRSMRAATDGRPVLETLLDPKDPLFGSKLAEATRQAWKIEAEACNNSEMAAVIKKAQQIAAVRKGGC